MHEFPRFWGTQLRMCTNTHAIDTRPCFRPSIKIEKTRPGNEARLMLTSTWSGCNSYSCRLICSFDSGWPWISNVYWCDWICMSKSNPHVLLACAYTTHIIQPLYVRVFRSFKTYFFEIVCKLSCETSWSHYYSRYFTFTGWRGVSPIFYPSKHHEWIQKVWDLPP